jgi:drug/metabolite transporter (DMT)-like permease
MDAGKRPGQIEHRMNSAPPLAPATNVDPTARGLWLGLLGVAIFALTLPMTRLAVGDETAPQLPPSFVTFGRAAVAGGLSLLYLMWLGSRGRLNIPTAGEWALLAFTALGVVLGFPMGLAMALREVPSTHAAVVTGLLPLATACVAAVWLRQRPSMAFWLLSLLGTALVLAFMAWRAGGLHLSQADAWLLLAMASASLGYVGGARLTPRLGAEQVICWILLLVLPVTLPLSAWCWPAHPAQIAGASWMAFGYVAVFSMWLGFFAWYRGLALGGTVRVSQVQLLQPFLSLLFALPVLGESLDTSTLLFGLAVTVTVLLGKRTSIPNHTARKT